MEPPRHLFPRAPPASTWSDQPIEPGASPLFCASGPTIRGESTACGSAGARSPGAPGCLPPGVLPMCPVTPQALPPAGTVGVHICVSMRRVHPPRALLPPAPRSPGPSSMSSLVPRALPVSPLRSDFCLLGWSLFTGLQHPVILKSRGFRFSRSVCEAGACPLEKASGGD